MFAFFANKNKTQIVILSTVMMDSKNHHGFPYYLFKCSFVNVHIHVLKFLSYRNSNSSLIFFNKYLDFFIKIPENPSLWPFYNFTLHLTVLSASNKFDFPHNKTKSSSIIIIIILCKFDFNWPTTECMTLFSIKKK